MKTTTTSTSTTTTRFVEFMNHYKEYNYLPGDEYTHILKNIQDNYVENMGYGQCGNPDAPLLINIKQTTVAAATEIIEKPKEKIHIENIEINSLQDLLDLAQKYPSNKNAEYNVQIEMIHCIADELNQIHSMIGIESIKSALLDQILYFMQKLDQHVATATGDGKKKTESDYKHTVLYGPPGTGKTEIANIMGKMYSKMGILSEKTFKKVTRSDLVAGYLGQTSMKTQKIINESLGGVLFIDEAYALAPKGDSSNGDSFSKECIDTLCENMSVHKENWMVIIAGYENELKNTFFKTNMGLESRFLWRFYIDNYSWKELVQIYEKKVKDQGWKLDMEISKLEKFIKDNMAHFKYYGRDMESLFTYSKIAHARKQFGKSPEKMRCISMENVKDGFDLFQKHRENRSTEICDPDFLNMLYS